MEEFSHSNLLSFRRQDCFVQEHLPFAYERDISSSLSPTLHSGTLFGFLHNGVHRGMPFFLHRHFRVQSLVIKTRPRLNRRPSMRQNFLGTGKNETKNSKIMLTRNNYFWSRVENESQFVGICLAKAVYNTCYKEWVVLLLLTLWQWRPRSRKCIYWFIYWASPVFNFWIPFVRMRSGKN